MRTCRGCDAPLERRSQLVYCSNACHRAMLRREATAVWLKTGEVAVRAERRHFVRLHLLEEQAHGCALCGLGMEWNGQTLVFVLDHVDGDATNNCRENLRLICPNCDSQLPTFKSRNRGNGRHARRLRYENGQSY